MCLTSSPWIVPSVAQACQDGAGASSPATHLAQGHVRPPGGSVLLRCTPQSGQHTPLCLNTDCGTLPLG